MKRQPVVLLAASVLVAMVLIQGASASVGAAPTSLGAASTSDWPAFLFRSAHPSSNAAVAITEANASSLNVYWHWKPEPPTEPGQPRAGLFSSPVVVAGRVYVGSNTGTFYALDLATKSVVWKRPLGYVTHKTCGARGLTSTATVVADPSRGNQLTVYVAGGDGYMYALRASDGAIVWRAVVAIPSQNKNDYYNWASPAVAGATVYMGVSSQCDNPLVPGGLKSYDQATGALVGNYVSVPPGSVGGAVWSSPAVDTGDVFITTGTGRKGDAESIVRLAGRTLAREDGWQIPPENAGVDADFGASPTLFSADLGGQGPTPMVGACNKNGLFYAMRRQSLSPGPVWQRQVADGSPHGVTSCIAAAIWDRSFLYVAASPTDIGGQKFQGSVQKLDPATGVPVWQTGLPGVVIGSPTMNGAGVIAAGTYDAPDPNAVYLLAATDGHIIRTVSSGNANVFAQPVFAGNYLFVATTSSGLYVYAPAP